MQKTELAKAVFDCAHLTGEFLLRSGQTSTEYFDKYRFESNPHLLREIAKQMAPMIPEETEVLAGLEMGGIPIVTALSAETGLPAAFVRKEAKAYGTCLFSEGAEVKDRKIVVVEDVVTTGGQAVISSGQLRDAGANILKIVCAIYRGPDEKPEALNEFGLDHLFTMQELKTAAE